MSTNNTGGISLGGVLVLIVAVMWLFNGVFDSKDEKKADVSAAAPKSKYIPNKWNEMLEHAVYSKTDTDHGVVCRTMYYKADLFTGCKYSINHMKRKPLFLHAGETLKAVNGAAKIALFLHYSDIEESNRLDIDIYSVIKAFQ